MGQYDNIIIVIVSSNKLITLNYLNINKAYLTQA